MRTSLSVKMLLRTPLKTLLTFLLIAATAYMLFFCVAEYVVTSREFERVIAFYKGIGAVEVEAAQVYRFSVNRGYREDYTYSVDMGTDFYLYTDERLFFNPYEDIADKYRYIGLTWADINAISELPYVTSANIRYMTAGVATDLKRSYSAQRNYDFTARFVIEGTVSEVVSDFMNGVVWISSSEPQKPAMQTSIMHVGYDITGELIPFYITLDNISILAADPDWHWHRVDWNRRGRDIHDIEGARVWLNALTFAPDKPNGTVIGYNFLNPTWFISVIHAGQSYYDEIYSHELLSGLVPGERYVIVGRMNTGVGAATGMGLSDSATIGWFPQVYPLKHLPENYLELPEFAPLREMIEITNTDLHTFDIVYTDDMSAIMHFADKKAFITEGRMLTAEDSRSSANVCVVSQLVVQENDLKIGDTIRIRLGDKLFEQNSVIGAVASVRERYADSFTEEIEFEIVGIYRDARYDNIRDKDLHWGYSENTIFIPDSFLPIEVPENHVVKPGEFSFVIDDARNITPFLDIARPIIEEDLGLTLYFNDGGWHALEKQINMANALAALRLPLFSFAVLVAIGLAVYLFIVRKRKEYAIMRALGTPRRVANYGLYVPLGLIAAAALIVGNALGYILAGNAIEGALSSYAEFGIEVGVAIPAFVVATCVICEAAAFCLVMAFGMQRIGNTPPLELLQAGTRRTRRAGTELEVLEVKCIPETGNTSVSSHHQLPSFAHPLYVVPQKRNASAKHVIPYVIKHIRRSTAKSLLSAGLALLLMGTIGQVTVIRGIYRDIYEDIGVRVYFLDRLQFTSAVRLSNSDYVRASYLESVISGSLECDHAPVTVVMTNDIGRFNEGATEIEFLESYDDTSIGEISAGENNICVLSAGFMDAFGIGLGDTVRFNSTGLKQRLENENLTDTNSIDERAAQDKKVLAMLDEQSAFYTVVGRIVHGGDANTAFVQVGSGLNVALGRRPSFDYVEYTLASPRYVDQFRSLATSNSFGASFLIDTSEADSMYRTVALLNSLYPIAVSIALLMGGLFAGLIVMQSDREAAIMRSLGTTKRRTCVIHVLEQAMLCVAGLLCAIAMLFAINGASLAAYAAALSLYAAGLMIACIAGAVICAIIVTRRRILELLQVKE